MLLNITSTRSFQLTAHTGTYVCHRMSLHGERIGVGPKPCRRGGGAQHCMMLYNARRQTNPQELHQQLLRNKCCLQADAVENIAQWHQRQSLQFTCQSQQQVTYSSTSPQAASPVLMAVSQNQTLEMQTYSMASEQRQSLHFTCQSQQVTYSSTSPQAAGPVLMAVPQDQSVDKL